MNSIILDCCNRLSERFEDTRTKEEFLQDKFYERLEMIYSQETNEIDELIKKLEVYVDYNSPKEVQRCVVKLLRLVSKSKSNLILLLKEMC